MIKKLFFILALSFPGILGFCQEGRKGMPVNATAPVFSGKDQNGKNISLLEDLKNGPVVLLFYRGQWCLEK